MHLVDPAFIEALKLCTSADRVLTRDEDVLPYSFDGTATLKQIGHLQSHFAILLQDCFQAPLVRLANFCLGN